MGKFDEIPTRSNANDDFVEASWWNIIKQKLQEAFPNVTTITGNVVGTTDVQTLTNKTFDDELTLKELAATPATPAATYKKIYPKDDGKIYALDSDGNEKEIGSGVGVGGVNFFDSDSAFIGDSIGSWETDDGAGNAATGLTLSVTTTVGEVIDGDGSLKIVKAAADHDGEFVKLGSETIAPAWRGKQMFGRIAIRPGTGYVSGDFRVQVWDLTNNAELYSGQSDDLEILNFSGIQFVNFTPYLESTTEEIEFRLVVNNTNTNGFDFFADLLTTGPASVLPATFERYEVIDLTGSGDFIGGSIGVGRTGNQVSITALTDITHASLSSASSAAGIIPSWARPGADKSTIFTNTIQIFRAFVTSSGAFGTNYTDYTGTGAARTGAGSLGTLAYYVPSTPFTMTTNELGLQSASIEASRSTNQSIANSTNTTVIFDTIDDDNIGGLNTSTGVFTAPKSQHYVFSTVVAFATNSTGQRTLRFASTPQSRNLAKVAAFGDTLQMNGHIEVYLEKGQTASIQVAQNSGGALNLTAGRLTISSRPNLTLIGAVKDAPSEIYLDTGNGHGSTATKVRRFTNTRKSQGNALTVTDTAADGTYVTVNEAGVYSIHYSDYKSSGAVFIAPTINVSSTTTNANSLTYANGRRLGVSTPGTNASATASWTGKLEVGDVIRAMNDGTANSSDAFCALSIIKI